MCAYLQDKNCVVIFLKYLRNMFSFIDDGFAIQLFFLNWNCFYADLCPSSSPLLITKVMQQDEEVHSTT